MKLFTVFVIVFTLIIGVAPAQTTKTVGGSGANYSTLQLAFAAINSGAIQGQIILKIAGNTTETALPVLYASGSGSSNYSSVLIYPTNTFTISTAGNWSAIDLNGADNVTIDGRINQTGNTSSLSIIGTSTENGAAGIRFVNSAENNTLKYCNIQACSASSSMGIVAIGGSISGNGNDNNIVEYCNLTNSGTYRPYNGIVSAGTGGRENNGCIIRNNNIYNTFQTAFSSNGININSSSVGFTISGNSIYETTAFVATANPLSYNAIRVSTTAEQTITGNYIGGSKPLCAGASWSFVGQRAVYFCGIYASAGSGTSTIISDNTIANIHFSSKEDNPWDGILLFTGNFEVSGNTIGSTTGTGSIKLTTPVPLATTTISGGVVTAINLLSGGSNFSVTPPNITFQAPPAGGTMPTATSIVSGGVLTGFKLLSGGSGYTTAPAVIFDEQSNNYSTSHGMIQNSTGTVNIIANNIGSITTLGSDYYSHGFEAIYVRTVLATTTINNNLIGSHNTVNSIHVSSAAASSLIKQDVYGIYSASFGTTTISGNTLANLTNAYSGINAGSRTRGIQTTAGSNIISNNTVFNISSPSKQSSNGSAASSIGISQTCTTAGTIQTIDGNTVYNIINTNPTDKSFVRGIYYSGPAAGTHTITGNFVHSLSIATTDINSDISGIELAGGSFTCANNIISLGIGITGGYFINGILDGSGTTFSRNVYFNTVYLGGIVSSGGSTTCALRNQNTGTRNYRNNVLFNARSGGGNHYAIYLQSAASLTNNYNDYCATGTNGVLGYLGADKTTLALLQTATGQDGNSKNINPGLAVAGGTSSINYYPSATLQGTAITEITTDYYRISRVLPKMGALERDENVWQGNTSNSFGTATNWASGVMPVSGTDIIFATSPTNDCVLDVDRTVGNITNGSAKNLLVNGKTLSINGNLNFTSSGKINTSTTSSVVKFALASAQTIPAAAFLNNTIAGLEIANLNGAALSGDLTVSAALTLTSGVLTIGANTLTYSGTSPTSGGGTIDASNASAELVFANATAITLPATFITGAVNNLTISASGGVTAGSDITVNGVLNLAAANPSAIKGLLEMVISYTNYPGTLITHYLNSHLLNMGASATTIGIGDVTGTVKRSSIVANTPYTFGHQYTTISLTPGTMPTALAVSITIGTSPKNTKVSYDIIDDAVKRTYEIVPTGGSDCYVTANFHYLDTELTSSNSPYHVNTEQKLTTMDCDIQGGYLTSDEHGRANYDYTNNYIGLSSVPISYFIQIPSTHEWRTIFALRDYGEGYFTWNGSVSTNWNTAANWTVGVSGSGVPTNTGHVIIPSVTNTNNRSPILPTGTTIINTISIENGGILAMGSNTLVIQNVFSGGWEDQNPLGNDPGNSTVVFNRPNTTISGTTSRFYNVQIADDADITNQTGSTMKIAGAITRTGSETGKWYADVFDATIEYNGGDQTVIHPDGTPDYHHLTLSGNGIKTMPSSLLSLHRNFTLSGTASATAAGNMSIGGNLSIETGTTFATGAFNHSVGGNIICDGTLTPISGSMITMNGSSAQSIQGEAATIAIGGLTVSNTNGVTLYNQATTAALDISLGVFTVTAGKSLTASGETKLSSAHCLVLKSDATGTASFKDNGTITSTNGGTALIERFLTPYDEVSDLKFHFLSSPVGNAQLIENEFVDLSSSAITDFYKWNEAGNQWTNYRGANYTEPNVDFGDSYKFVPGMGYLVAYPATVTKNFVGVPYTGSLTVNCTHGSGGWNLIGNPFPSSVDWDLVGKGDGMDAALYYYDNATPGYKYYSFFSGGLAGASQYIAPMQGFMVHAKNSGVQTVTLANAARTHQGQNVFYKKSEQLLSNILNMKVEGNGMADYARVCFYDQATENFDGDFDAFKLFSYSPAIPQLYSITPDNTTLAINTLPLTRMEGSIPIGFKAGTAGAYTFTAENLQSFDASVAIYLKDLKNGIRQNLNTKSVYTFTSATGDLANRFELVFSSTTGLSESAVRNFNIYAVGNTIHILNENSTGPYTVMVMNMLGQVVYKSKLEGSTLNSININRIPGMYIVSVISEGSIYSSKVVVK